MILRCLPETSFFQPIYFLKNFFKIIPKAPPATIATAIIRASFTKLANTMVFLSLFISFQHPPAEQKLKTGSSKATFPEMPYIT